MQNSYIEIGRTRKMHGTNGQLKMSVNPQFAPSFEEVSVIFMEDGKKRTPYFVENIETIADLYLVKLEEVDNKEAAQRLTNRVIYLREGDILEATTNSVEGEDEQKLLIGFQIVHKDGTKIGVITAIQEFPQQIMAIIQYQGNEVLIPMNEAFIQELNLIEKRIIMDLPEGLLEL